MVVGGLVHGSTVVHAQADNAQDQGAGKTGVQERTCGAATRARVLGCLVTRQSTRAASPGEGDDVQKSELGHVLNTGFWPQGQKRTAKKSGAKYFESLVSSQPE